MYRPPLDLKEYVDDREGESLARASTEVIVRECLGEELRLEKWISMSDWDDETLSYDQVEQACSEARAAFLIGVDIRAWRY